MVVSVVLVNTAAGVTLIRLPAMIPPPLFSAELGAYGGLFLAVLAAVAVFVLLNFTLWGFDIRAMTGNARAARFAGIPVSATVLRVGLMSGALAGLAGACMIALLGRQGIAGLLPRVGYAGILVATLAALSPLAVVFAALFLGGALVGIESMSRSIGLPIELADIVVGLMLTMTVLGDTLVRYRLRWIRPRKVTA
jgi:general nucleoside transport system permease protein